MYSEQPILDLVGLAYDAAGDSRLWPVFLERLAAEVKASSANLSLQDLGSQSGEVQVISGVDPSCLRAYNEYYGTMDCWAIHAAPLLVSGAVLTDEMMCPTPQLLKTEFFNDFLRPQHHSRNICGVIFQEETRRCVVSLQRSEEAGAYTASETQLLHAIMPHLQRAFQLHGQIAGLKMLSATADAVAALDVGLVGVSRHGRVIFANALAESILQAGDVLCIRDGKLAVTRDASSAGELAAQIQMARSRKYYAGTGVALTIRGDSRMLYLTVLPLAGAISAFDDSQVIITITDPSSRPQSRESLLAALFGLTASEIRVAMLLLEGLASSEIAARTRTTANAVRFQLKMIYRKIGVRGQSQLIRLMSRLPGTK